MGIINKLYDVHVVPSKNVQFSIDEEARNNSLSKCNFGLCRKPPPRPPPLPTSIGTFSEFGVMTRGARRGFVTLIMGRWEARGGS